MPTIYEAERYETEEIIRIPVTGAERCYVISGFADFTWGDSHETKTPVGDPPTGSSYGDTHWATRDVHIVVGDKYNEIVDVSPTAGIAGFHFRDSDETDSTGIELESCKWDTVGVEGEPSFERIRLKIKLRMCGGTQSRVTKISYHLVALVKIYGITG